MLTEKHYHGASFHQYVGQNGAQNNRSGKRAQYDCASVARAVSPYCSTSSTRRFCWRPGSARFDASGA